MGIFNFFKRKAKKSSVNSNKIQLEKMKNINLKITEVYQDFTKKIKETDDGSFLMSMSHWYDVVKNMASQHPIEENSSFDLKIKGLVYGNYDEYKTRDDLIDADDEYLKDFVKIRISSFGEVYFQLTLLEKKINKLLSDNSIKKHKVSVQLNNELARAKARTYGAIKYALSVNISKSKIKEWFPAFIDDNELIDELSKEEYREMTKIAAISLETALNNNDSGLNLIISTHLNKAAWGEMEAGNYNEALKKILESIELISYSDNNNTAAMIYFHLQDFEKGLEYSNESIKINETNSEHFYNRAQILVKLDKIDLAIKDLKKAIASDGFEDAKKLLEQIT